MKWPRFVIMTRAEFEPFLDDIEGRITRLAENHHERIERLETLVRALEDAYLVKPTPEPEPERGLLGGFVPHSVKKKRMERALAKLPEKGKP